jgi:hypothetical protein
LATNDHNLTRLYLVAFMTIAHSHSLLSLTEL